MGAGAVSGRLDRATYSPSLQQQKEFMLSTLPPGQAVVVGTNTYTLLNIPVRRGEIVRFESISADFQLTAGSATVQSIDLDLLDHASGGFLEIVPVFLFAGFPAAAAIQRYALGAALISQERSWSDFKTVADITVGGLDLVLVVTTSTAVAAAASVVGSSLVSRIRGVN